MFRDVQKEGKNDVKFVLAIYVAGEYAYFFVRYHLRLHCSLGNGRFLSLIYSYIKGMSFAEPILLEIASYWAKNKSTTGSQREIHDNLDTVSVHILVLFLTMMLTLSCIKAYIYREALTDFLQSELDSGKGWQRVLRDA